MVTLHCQCASSNKKSASNSRLLPLLHFNHLKQISRNHLFSWAQKKSLKPIDSLKWIELFSSVFKYLLPGPSNPVNLTVKKIYNKLTVEKMVSKYSYSACDMFYQLHLIPSTNVFPTNSLPWVMDHWYFGLPQMRWQWVSWCYHDVTYILWCNIRSYLKLWL